jgi:hypothetical protein
MDLLVTAALVVSFTAVSASADGLYLKLAAEKREASAGAVAVRLTALATRPLDLEAVPLFFVDQGQGMRAEPDLAVTAPAGSTPLKLAPGASVKRSFELRLPPGRHRVKARYRFADRVIDSNTITLTVPSASPAAGR